MTTLISLNGYFYSSLILLIIVILTAILLFITAVIWVQARKERETTEKIEKNIKKHLNQKK